MDRIRRRIFKFYLKELKNKKDCSSSEKEGLFFVLKSKVFFDAIFYDSFALFEKEYKYDREKCASILKYIEWLWSHRDEIIKLILIVVSFMNEEKSHDNDP